MDLADRLWSRVDRSGGDDACWPWLAFRSPGPEGYGRVRACGKNDGAHRVSYELLVGPIPEGLHIDHLCRNKWCVNPRHLELVTPAENTRRGLVARGRDTHCSKGHLFDEENTYVPPKRTDQRHCRECQRLREREWKARKREARHAC